MAQKLNRAHYDVVVVGGGCRCGGGSRCGIPAGEYAVVGPDYHDESFR